MMISHLRNKSALEVSLIFDFPLPDGELPGESVFQARDECWMLMARRSALSCLPNQHDPARLLINAEREIAELHLACLAMAAGLYDPQSGDVIFANRSPAAASGAKNSKEIESGPPLGS
jgi:hypothetical protein